MPLLTGLVSYYTLDEASGTRADSAGANNLSDTGSVGSAAGKIGLAASFTGAGSDYLAAGASFGEGAAGVALSWSLWLNSDTASGDHQAVGRFDGSRLFQLGISGSSGIRVAYGVSPFDAIQAGSAVTAGAWYHVVFTLSTGGVGTLYVNGSAVGTDASLTGAFDSTTPVNVGRRGGDGAEPWDGLVDEVGLWSRELSGADVTALYNAGAGLAYPFGGGAAKPWWQYATQQLVGV